MRTFGNTAVVDGAPERRQSVRRSPLILLALDMQSRIADVGLAWEQVLGYSRADTLRRELVEFMPADYADPISWSAPISQLLVERREFPLLTRQGNILWFEYSAHLGSADRVSGYLLDITPQKELEAIGDFLAKFAAQLQAPVTALSRSLQELLQHPQQAEHHRPLQNLLLSSRALTTLSDELDHQVGRLRRASQAHL